MGAALDMVDVVTVETERVADRVEAGVPEDERVETLEPEEVEEEGRVLSSWYTLSREPPPQVSVVLSVQGVLQSFRGAGTEEAANAFPHQHSEAYSTPPRGSPRALQALIQLATVRFSALASVGRARPCVASV